MTIIAAKSLSSLVQTPVPASELFSTHAPWAAPTGSLHCKHIKLFKTQILKCLLCCFRRLTSAHLWALSSHAVSLGRASDPSILVRVLCYWFSSIDSLYLSDTVLRRKRTSLVSQSATNYKLHKMTNKLANLKLYDLWLYDLFIYCWGHVGLFW